MQTQTDNLMECACMGVFMFMCVNARANCVCVCVCVAALACASVYMHALSVNFRHSYYTPTDGIAKCML